jgi:hypothetical protein
VEDTSKSLVISWAFVVLAENFSPLLECWVFFLIILKKILKGLTEVGELHNSYWL